MEAGGEGEKRPLEIPLCIPSRPAVDPVGSRWD